jgi:Aromatic-ring-opening dioxygenase LigAB, LigA subunit
MSLYYVQKLLYQLNRDPGTQKRFAEDRDGLLAEYELTGEERQALAGPDIGLLYVLGVNGQLLMHYAALHKIEWNDYLHAMRDGLAKHGAVREGVYATTGYEGVEAHDARLRARKGD